MAKSRIKIERTSILTENTYALTQLKDNYIRLDNVSDPTKLICVEPNYTMFESLKKYLFEHEWGDWFTIETVEQ